MREEVLECEIRRIKDSFLGFHVNLALYYVVNAGFSFYVLMTGGPFWPIYPIVFCGSGVIYPFSALKSAKISAGKELNALRRNREVRDWLLALA